MTRKIILLILLYTGIKASGQRIVTVTYVDGQAEFSSDRTKWTRVKEKMQLGDGVWFRLHPKAYVVLSRDKEELVLDNQDHNNKKISDMPFVKQEGFLARLYHLFTEYTAPETTRRKVPALTRGWGCNELLPADYEVLTEEPFRFLWNKENVGYYKFSLLESDNWLYMDSEINDTVLFSQDVRKQGHTFDHSKKYLWHVRIPGDEAAQASFKEFTFASADTLKKIQEELAVLEKYKQVGDGKLYYLLTAAYYENRKMYTKASEYYTEAEVRFGSSAQVRAICRAFTDRLLKINNPE